MSYATTTTAFGSSSSSSSSSSSDMMFAMCEERHGEENQAAILKCIAESLEQKYDNSVNNVTSWLLVLCGTYTL